MQDLATWCPVWHIRLQQPAQPFWQTAWLLVGPLAAYFGLVYSAFRLYTTNQMDLVYTNIALTAVIDYQRDTAGEFTAD